MQHFKLGQWFRNRYDGFLSSVYNKDEIYIRSSDGDRCVMSASADLAGLYPPSGKDIWNDNLAWQPIPVHTLPKEQDDIAEVYHSCAKYNHLKAAAEKELPYFRDFNAKNKNLYDQLSEKSGENISNIVQANSLFDTLHIEKIYNFTIPNWADELYSSLKEIGDTSPRLFTATAELTRLFMGRYFDNVLKQFEFCSSGTGPITEKFRIFSGHDDQVFSILSALNVQKLKAVPYAAVAILELRKSSNDDLFVQLFYKTKEHVADLIPIPNCGDQCSYEKFVEIVQPIALSKEEFNSECQNEMN